jgi:hypothetical protein
MRLRLKDLDKISGESIDTEGVETVVTEVVGFRKKWFFNKMLFGIAIRKAITLIRNGRNLNIAALELNKDCNIKVPSNIDNITFRAMIELQSTMGNAHKDSNVVDLMSSVIAITCYSENINDKLYDSECDEFIEFKETILNEPMEHMIGLYNYIVKTTQASQLDWKKRFMSVEISSEDMRQAGVNALQQFSVLNTIKTLCTDFNCNYDEAWQMGYGITQTNSYAKATYDHVHENLRILKEHKMKAQRRAKNS